MGVVAECPGGVRSAAYGRRGVAGVGGGRRVHELCIPFCCAVLQMFVVTDTKISAAPMRSVSSAVIGGGLTSLHSHLMSELSGIAVVECLSSTLVSGGVGFAFRHSLGWPGLRVDSWSLAEAVVAYAFGTHRAARMDRVPLGGGGAASMATQKRGPTRLVNVGNCSRTLHFDCTCHGRLWLRCFVLLWWVLRPTGRWAEDAAATGDVSRAGRGQRDRNTQ